MFFKSYSKNITRNFLSINSFSTCSNLISPSLSSSSTSTTSTTSTTWNLPLQSLLAKNLTKVDILNVKESLEDFNINIPIERNSMPPSSWYLTESFMRAEMSGIFSKTWQFACRADQVNLPGQYVATYTANADPILISRGNDGILRAFSNVCRHHAARVAEGCGIAKEFVCPYHSWTYNQEGRLVKATKLKGIQDFTASKVRLTQLGVEQWGPLIFVNHNNLLNDKNNHNSDSNHILWKQSISNQLSDVVKAIDEMECKDLEGNILPKWSEGDWKNFHFLQRRVYEIKCNWKVYCDNYLDGGYHIPSLHLGLNSELDMSSYRTELYDTVSIQRCRAKSDRVGSDAVYAFLFPNLAINRYGDWLDTNLVLPLAPDRCIIVFDWYHRYATPINQQSTNDDKNTINNKLLNLNDILLASLEQSKTIQDEDISISESVQCGIGSITYDKGRYAPGVEIAEFHYHKLIHQALSEEINLLEKK